MPLAARCWPAMRVRTLVGAAAFGPLPGRSLLCRLVAVPLGRFLSG